MSFGSIARYVYVYPKWRKGMSNEVNLLSAQFFTYDSPEPSNYDFLEEVIYAMTNSKSVTSEAAANTVNKNNKYGKLAALALAHIKNSGPFGMTRGELSEKLNRPQHCLTSALKMLEKKKFVGRTGATRLYMESGHSQQIYYARMYLP